MIRASTSMHCSSMHWWSWRSVMNPPSIRIEPSGRLAAALLLQAQGFLETIVGQELEPDQHPAEPQRHVGRGDEDHLAVLDIERDFIAIGDDREPPGLLAKSQQVKQVGDADIADLTHERHRMRAPEHVESIPGHQYRPTSAAWRRDIGHKVALHPGRAKYSVR